MGYRTVVILSNDRAHEWEHDPLLGEKIASATTRSQRLEYGSVIEVTHCDVQSLVILDSLSSKRVASNVFPCTPSERERDVALLKEFAKRLCFNCVPM